MFKYQMRRNPEHAAPDDPAQPPPPLMTPPQFGDDYGVSDYGGSQAHERLPDIRIPGENPYDVVDREGADASNDPLMQPPHVRGIRPNMINREGNSLDAGDYREPITLEENPEAFQKVIQRYDPRDTNQDGIVDEIEQYQAFLKQSPEERRINWVHEHLTPRGFSADYETGEIVDTQGNVVGTLPSFN